MRGRTLVVLLLVVAALSLLGVARSSHRSAQGTSGFVSSPGDVEIDVVTGNNVVLFVIDDAWRSFFPEDNQPLATAVGVAMPELDSVATQGARFTSVTTEALCGPTKIELQTGLESWVTGAYDNPTADSAGYDLDNKHIAEVVCKDSQMVCGRFGKTGKSPWLDANFGYDHGIGQTGNTISDYDIGSNVHHDWNILNQASNGYIAWAAAQTKPHFAWIHPHILHTPMHEPTDTAEPWDGTQCGAASTYTDEQCGQAMAAYLDTLIEDLIDAIDFTDTYLIIVSDDGYSMATYAPANTNRGWGAKGGTGVELSLYIRGPGITAGQVIAGPARMIDVYPTILSMVGRKLPPADDAGNPLTFNGQNLLTIVQDGSDIDRRYHGQGRREGSDSATMLDERLPAWVGRWPATTRDDFTSYYAYDWSTAITTTQGEHVERLMLTSFDRMNNVNDWTWCPDGAFVCDDFEYDADAATPEVVSITLTGASVPNVAVPDATTLTTDVLGTQYTTTANCPDPCESISVTQVNTPDITGEVATNAITFDSPIAGINAGQTIATVDTTGTWPCEVDTTVDTLGTTGDCEATTTPIQGSQYLYADNSGTAAAVWTDLAGTSDAPGVGCSSTALCTVEAYIRNNTGVAAENLLRLTTASGAACVCGARKKNGAAEVYQVCTSTGNTDGGIAWPDNTISQIKLEHDTRDGADLCTVTLYDEDGALLDTASRASGGERAPELRSESELDNLRVYAAEETTDSTFDVNVDGLGEPIALNFDQNGADADGPFTCTALGALGYGSPVEGDCQFATTPLDGTYSFQSSDNGAETNYWYLDFSSTCNATDICEFDFLFSIDKEPSVANMRGVFNVLTAGGAADVCGFTLTKAGAVISVVAASQSSGEVSVGTYVLDTVYKARIWVDDADNQCVMWMDPVDGDYGNGELGSAIATDTIGTPAELWLGDGAGGAGQGAGAVTFDNITIRSVPNGTVY